jgi:hypothetical protein
MEIVSWTDFRMVNIGRRWTSRLGYVLVLYGSGACYRPKQRFKVCGCAAWSRCT